MKTTLRIALTLILAAGQCSCFTSRTVRYPDGRWERTVSIGLRAEISNNGLIGTTAKAQTTPGGLIGAAIGIAGKLLTK